MDQQQHLVRLRERRTGKLVEKTTAVREYAWLGDKLRVIFDDGATCTYNADNVDVRTGTVEHLAEPRQVLVDCKVWNNALAITRFGDRTRVTCGLANGKRKHYLYESSRVELLTDAAASGDAAAVLQYWRALASTLKLKDPARMAFDRLTFVHPDSALAAYLHAVQLDALPDPTPAIYPFSSNISQRAAVDKALSHQISVIEGPPGAGKTQTILNIIASMVAAGNQSIAVVSSTNSAVDNVREKLDKLGIGYVAAALGKKANQDAFVAHQDARIAAVEAAMKQPAPADPLPAAKVEQLTNKLRQAQQWDRDRARLETEIAAYQLEHRHFTEHLEGRQIPELEELPLLRKAPERILDYLVETSVETTKPGFVTRVRRYFKYGRTGDIDPRDVEVLLRLQERYYQRRIEKLTADLAEVNSKLERADLGRLISEHTAASHARLQQALRERYTGRPRRTYEDKAWQTDRDFLTDYPVIVSTCHSLARNLPPGHLVDLLIIDEASQVSLLIAAAAMACAKRVVVVGDTRQLPHITGSITEVLEAPHPAYDYREHNLLSSLHALHGTALPSEMLVEHYRCAPEIIGYCNRSFYDGKLINFTRRESPGTAMHVWATVEGNHMRTLSGGRGTSNEREIDVIRKEVIPGLGLVGRQVGYVSPYRLQADKLDEAVNADEPADGDGKADSMVDVSVRAPGISTRAQADTVHRFQGRECDVVVMSSVADNSWRGEYALRFVDDARLINVAVSRAVNDFVLVTHPGRHPKSRYLADLIGYIEYHDPTAIRESMVVSIFDLLYKDYSERLKPFAARIRRESQYPSEDAARTQIQDVLTTERYCGLELVTQYRLAHLFTDLDQFTAEQQRFIRTTSSVDFLIYRKVSLRPVLAIEVDGWAFHENKPDQLARDRKKDSIFQAAGLPLLRLPTTGSGEEARIRSALDAALSVTSATPGATPFPGVTGARVPTRPRWRGPGDQEGRTGYATRACPQSVRVGVGWATTGRISTPRPCPAMSATAQSGIWCSRRPISRCGSAVIAPLQMRVLLGRHRRSEVGARGAAMPVRTSPGTMETCRCIRWSSFSTVPPTRGSAPIGPPS